VYSKDQLISEAMKLAEEMAKIHPHLIQGAKRAVNIAASTPLDVGLRMETDICLSSGSGVTMGEAAQQFVRKEQPQDLRTEPNSSDASAGHP
jgi:enoyl-CoA hydratase/carnithine racemase